MVTEVREEMDKALQEVRKVTCGQNENINKEMEIMERHQTDVLEKGNN